VSSVHLLEFETLHNYGREKDRMDDECDRTQHCCGNQDATFVAVLAFQVFTQVQISDQAM